MWLFKNIKVMNYLIPKQIEKYQQDGFLVVKSVFMAKECELLKKALIDQINTGKNDLKKYLTSPQKKVDKNKIADIPRGVNDGYLQDIAHRNPDFMNLAKDSRLIDIVGQIFGSNSKEFHLYRSTSIFKNSSISSKTFWHQDMTYWKGDPNKLSVWISLNKVNKQNGSPHYIPGSQRKSFKHIVKGKGKIPLLEAQDINESEKVIIEADIGDIIIHGPHVLHGSEENVSGEERYAIILTYQPTTDISHHRSGLPELIKR